MNRKEFPFSLLYLPLLIRLKCHETARLPAYLGSTLHGVTGWALLQHSEVYSYLFENRRLGGAGQDIVNPYIIEPPRSRSIYRSGEELCFKLVLLGDSIRYAKDVVTALTQAQRFGIGAERKVFELVDILHGERYRPIWQDGQLDMMAANPENITACGLSDQASWCSVHMLTPLRIRRGGALVQEIDFATIIRSITRRIHALTERYGGEINPDVAKKVCELAGNVRTLSSAMYLSQMNRYSNRKNESIDWSGMLGAVTFEGDISPFTPWLNAARILHIGRNSTFGCGQMDVVYR
ncbi:CRISPR system precrRNA processing endoribonuclease RAMP protein Cas6 [Paenibacillus pabuli]|uniref:CRISPR system precrRNA processing endoribonuclease RAMP protein Cas6 n=1 Tax=Paenibacillus pabuli TaxID=1472 RepID=UPI001FFF28FF|nr:CRISPR system precrRNA processing endoribonuclease RAMP protein Cas6 [Paenibacillus pabuli]UPK45006.1 CRISPR system precrRNA processing endoribonuclease RAMP protein Cas6 [Paenibacillus pabuli]